VKTIHSRRLQTCFSRWRLYYGLGFYLSSKVSFSQKGEPNVTQGGQPKIISWDNGTLLKDKPQDQTQGILLVGDNFSPFKVLKASWRAPRTKFTAICMQTW
jgi:hypothetical protein